MKNVRIRFFAVFRDATGMENFEHLTSAKTAKDLFAEMAQQFSGLHVESAALVAINDELTSWDEVICEGDEVLFFPPVAGG